MKTFLSRFGALIVAVLSGFDRLRFRGCSRLLSNPRGVNSYLFQHDLLLKEYAAHAERLTRTLVRGSAHWLVAWATMRSASWPERSASGCTAYGSKGASIGRLTAAG